MDRTNATEARRFMGLHEICEEHEWFVSSVDEIEYSSLYGCSTVIKDRREPRERPTFEVGE